MADSDINSPPQDGTQSRADAPDASAAAPGERFPSAFRRRRLRFSLLTLLLATAVTCLAVSHFRTSWELHRTTIQLQRLRNESGHLHVSDPGKIHALALRTHRDMVWEWRVHVPERTEYKLHARVNEVPWEGAPDDWPVLTLPAGESLVAASIFRDHRGQWQLKTSAFRTQGGQNARTQPLKNKDTSWLAEKAGGGHGESGVLAGSSAGANGTATFEPDEPAVLLRLRVFAQDPGGGSSSEPDAASDGLMLWIAPAKQ